MQTSRSPQGSTPERDSVPGDRGAWQTPALKRLGAVEALTAKVDTIGTNDGGVGTMKRT